MIKQNSWKNENQINSGIKWRLQGRNTGYSINNECINIHNMQISNRAGQMSTGGVSWEKKHKGVWVSETQPKHYGPQH